MGLFNSKRAEKYEVKGNYYNSHPNITGHKSLLIKFDESGANILNKKKLIRQFTWNEIISFDLDDRITQSNSKRVTGATKDILHTTSGDIILQSGAMGGSPSSLTGSTANFALIMHSKHSNNVKRFVAERTTYTPVKTLGQSSSVADEIEKYAKLKDAGAITQVEFETKKKQLLDP